MTTDNFKKEFAKEIVKKLKKDHYVDNKTYFTIAENLKKEHLTTESYFDMIEITLESLKLINGDVYTKVNEKGQIFVFDKICPAITYIIYTSEK